VVLPEVVSKTHATPRTNRAEFDLCVKARAGACDQAISVSAVIEINVFDNFDYSVHARARCVSVAEVNNSYLPIELRNLLQLRLITTLFQNVIETTAK